MKTITALLAVTMVALILSGCDWGDDDDDVVADTAAPTAPANLLATPAGTSQVDLGWTAATDNTGVTAYLVERCQGANCSNYTQIAQVAGDVTAYADATVMGSARYGYRVRASDAAGNLGDYDEVATQTAALEGGLKTMNVDGEERSYYLDLPSDYDADADPRPLIIAYHGTGGSYQAWLDYYRLKELAVADGAVLVYPDARPNGAGTKQWDFEDDFRMFEEFMAQLPGQVSYDPDRIFVTGHSSGGGFSHELGCRYGDLIRAIAPVAGSLTATSCTGAVAVIQIQGEFDSLVPANIAGLGRRFWVLYNGFVSSSSVPGVQSPCVSYALSASDFPVEWCLHQEGSNGLEAHGWPGFANSAIWAFFQGLSDVAAPHPAAPPGGGNERALGNADTTLSITLSFPPGMPNPVKLAAVLGPPGAVQPITGAPLAFLNLDIAPGAVGGDTRSYSIPITYTDLGGITFPGSYTLEIVSYNEGSGFPIPASGIDYIALVPVDLVDKTTPLVIPGVIPLEVVNNGF